MLLSKIPNLSSNHKFRLATIGVSSAIGLLAFTTPSIASTLEFSQKFIAPDGASSDQFGNSVALDGDYALIGSRADDDKGYDSGSAYLFDVTNGNLLQKFIAPDGASSDKFGGSVALDGGFALIGSRFDDDKGRNSGSAYLFDVTSGNLLQKFTAPGDARWDQFGGAVALNGDYALIGTRGDDDKGYNSGSAYLFDVTSGNLLQKFIPPDGAGGDWFGNSVTLDGDYALIGSSSDDDNGTDSGSAYLFDITSGKLLQKIIAPDGASGDSFSQSVALDGNYALISSFLDDDNGLDSGSAYLFDITSGNLLQKIIAPDGASGDYFSQSVALDGDYALISSRGNNDNGSDSGSAYLFDITSGKLLQKLIAPSGASEDYFSFSVALDKNNALISSSGDDDNGPESGSAHLYARKKVPEPSAIFGLIAMGTLGVLKRFSGKQTR